MNKVAVRTLWLACAVATGARGADGDLDASFGVGGVVEVALLDQHVGRADVHHVAGAVALRPAAHREVAVEVEPREGDVIGGDVDDEALEAADDAEQAELGAVDRVAGRLDGERAEAGVAAGARPLLVGDGVEHGDRFGAERGALGPDRREILAGVVVRRHQRVWIEWLEAWIVLR